MVVTAVAVGTRGDVDPITELGREMTARGHEFRILTHETFRELVESKGSKYYRLDTDASHVLRYLVTDYKTSLDFARGMFKLKKENPAFMEQTIDAIRGSDLVMYGICGAFASHAAESLDIPCARLFYSPMDPTRQYSLYSEDYDSDSVLKSYGGLSTGMNLMTMLALNGWRRSAGLPKWRLDSTYTERDGRKLLTFYPTSQVLMPPDPEWGEHIHVTGYWYSPDKAEAGYEEPEGLEEFLSAGEKPIFVAFGKAESAELARLQSLTVAALKESGIRAVVQAEQIDDKDRVNTDRLFFIGQVPYSYIFKRVRAVVHHGGNTTNGLGLRAGLPTLVVALALDQYFYGRMDHRIDAGPKPLYIRKRLCDVGEIKSALHDLVSGRYDKGAAAAGERIRAENGVKVAADAIEDYIG